ncbi:MAG: alpha/beta hydrolase [Hyphomicrobiales bacterium]|nr:alpha/beta hydrolase [Hyphomicrobiales bacterium]
MQIIPSIPPRTQTIRDQTIEIFEQGSGDPLLFLHPARGLDGCETFLTDLAGKYRVIAPSHPGFGRSEAPYWMNTVEDLAYFYLDFLDALGIEKFVLAGSSFGGWIAASLATKMQKRLSALVLIDPLGVKISDREQRDIADVFAMKRVDLMAAMFHDPKNGAFDLASLDDSQLTTIARHRESEGLYGWSPYMHDPKLKTRLHRIDAPALVLAGASDRITRPAYAKAYAELMHGAHFEEIADAGHLPMIEQPGACAAAVLAFLAGQ